MPTAIPPPPDLARLEARPEGQRLVLAFSGRLDIEAAARLWRAAMRAAADRPAARAGEVVLDLAGLTALDSAGATLLLRIAEAAGPRAARFEGASAGVATVLARTRAALAAPGPPPGPPPLSPLAALGRAGVARMRRWVGGIGFLGEAAAATLRALRRPALVRGRDVLRHLDEVGTRAFPLTVLLGTLIGVILAFQSSIPMRRFGAEVFIPQLVGISLLRELGPLLAAVILAGRTGSAFAAELGTMTVNEEVSALRIMGVDPVAMLVLPRLLAATLAMPVLTLLLDLAGLVGMGAVMGTLGFPPAAVLAQLEQALSLGDLLGGLFKAAVFGLVVGGIGCHAGLSAGMGPRAVGDAATAAVVGGIVATIVLDGLFAVLFFRLGL
ncbi:ABC transporter permease [Caldovatus sediminis]|uniref:ABC transporter permease n=1 Tax=Caldovatus sediminis TaxID=2041189 RepID=A0A8J2ZEB2_9PROT|nr:ABC transporter permease [Caldovatus sediminis]GGG45484.1 ABC transporter permease [Caldovatus sediminis]